MFNIDKKYVYIFLIIMVFYRLSAYMQDPSALIGLIVSLPAVIIAMTFHEFAHAYAADKLGDETPRSQGRVTLNPLKHIDPVGFVMLLFAGFGWGRPVQINPIRFKRDISMSKGEAIVAFAGPLMNFILAIISTLVLGLSIKFNLLLNLSIDVQSLIIVFLYEMIFMNIGLGVFNLIPIPPLDGSKVLRHFLPTKAQMWLDEKQEILYILFLVLIMFRRTSVITEPIIKAVAYAILYIVSKLLGIDLTFTLGL